MVPIIWLYITVVVVVISFSIIVSCILISLLLVSVGIMYIKMGSNINVIIFSISFDGENNSFEASLVMYINSTNIPQIMIMHDVYTDNRDDNAPTDQPTTMLVSFQHNRQVIFKILLPSPSSKHRSWEGQFSHTTMAVRSEPSSGNISKQEINYVRSQVLTDNKSFCIILANCHHQTP